MSCNFEFCRVYKANCFCTEALISDNCKVAAVGGVETCAFIRKAMGLLAKKDGALSTPACYIRCLKRAITHLGEWPTSRRSQSLDLKPCLDKILGCDQSHWNWPNQIDQRSIKFLKELCYQCNSIQSEKPSVIVQPSKHSLGLWTCTSRKWTWMTSS